MILFIAAAFVVGILIGRAWRDINIQKAAKNGTVLTVEGELYSVKKEDRHVDPGGVR